MNAALPDLSVGACVGEDTERFFDRGYTAVTAEAKNLCRSCPVQQDCLDYALRVAVEGVWGATTDAERKVIRHERGLPPPIEVAGQEYTDPPPRDYTSQAHLTEEQVREARYRYATGNHSMGELAVVFGVSKTAMVSLIRGQSYRWVA